MLSDLLRRGMAFSSKRSHPHAKTLSRFLLFAFGLFLLLFFLRRGFCCLRSPWCGARTDSSCGSFPWSSRRYAFGPCGRRTHFRFASGPFLLGRRFCCLRSPWSGARPDPSFRPFPWSSRRHAFGRTGRRAHFSAGLLRSTTFGGLSLAAWRRLVWSSRPAGTCDAATFEFAGLHCGGNGRTAAVYRRPLLGISSGGPHLLPLCAGE